MSLLQQDQQFTATRRDAVDRNVQNNVEQKVKEQLKQAGPELQKAVEAAAQAAASSASRSGSTVISFSAAQKSSLVGATVSAVVEQLGAGLSPAYKSALKSQLTDVINYSLREELAKIESGAAERRRIERDEEPNSKANSNRYGVASSNANKSGSALGASALFSSATEAETSQAGKRGFGFGNRTSNANASAAGLADAITQPVAQAISVATPVAAKEPAAQKAPLAVNAAAMSIKEIELAISGAFKKIPGEVQAVRTALEPLKMETGVLTYAAGKAVDPAQVAQTRAGSAAPTGAFAYGLRNAHEGSFNTFLRRAAAEKVAA